MYLILLFLACFAWGKERVVSVHYIWFPVVFIPLQVLCEHKNELAERVGKMSGAGPGVGQKRKTVH